VEVSESLSEKELVSVYASDPVSGAPVSEIKQIKVDLDAAVEDPSLEHLLTPEELILVRRERERRRRKMSGVNKSIISIES
jgi:hypothetical protein